MKIRKTILKDLISVLGDAVKPEYESCVIEGINTLEKAGSHELSFFAHDLYKEQLQTTAAKAVLLQAKHLAYCPPSAIALVVADPKLALAKILHKCAEQTHSSHLNKLTAGVHPAAVIGNNVSIAKSAYIGPYCVLGDNVVIEEGVKLISNVRLGADCAIGKNSVLYPNVVFYHDVIAGAACVFHAGVVIGGEGFGYARDFEQNSWLNVPHLAGVRIGNYVEIGCNTTIDRGFLEHTIIEDGVIIDNQVQIGHNVFIGQGTAIAGCVGIAGSARIGKHCLIGGGAGIAGHIKIADGVHITATTAVNRSISEKGVYSSGLPARENNIWRKNVARFNTLESLAARLKVLERQIKADSFMDEFNDDRR